MILGNEIDYVIFVNGFAAKGYSGRRREADFSKTFDSREELDKFISPWISMHIHRQVARKIRTELNIAEITCKVLSKPGNITVKLQAGVPKPKLQNLVSKMYDIVNKFCYPKQSPLTVNANIHINIEYIGVDWVSVQIRLTASLTLFIFKP